MKNIDKKLWSRRIFLMMYDIIAMVGAGILALLMRFELDYYSIELKYLEELWRYMPINIIVTLVVFYAFRLYHSLWAYVGIAEMQNIISACVISSLLQMAGILGTKGHMPRSYYPMYGMIFLLLILSSRLVYRFLRTKRNQWRAKKSGNLKNVMVIGAGEAGNSILKEIVTSKYLTTIAKCVIDDNPEKIGKFIHGVKVVGNRDYRSGASLSYRPDYYRDAFCTQGISDRNHYDL